MKDRPNMYVSAKTWNPFKGCEFDCTYCVPSFQRQSKRQKHLCLDCYNYKPHCHEDRLERIPSSEIVFVCGNADISFCPPEFTRRIVDRIIEHNTRVSNKTYYLQSKNPAYFDAFLKTLPQNVILLTTLETNRDQGYQAISKAPRPSTRYQQFRSLDYPRKVVTIEPLLDFDLEVLVEWVCSIKPEYVWLGFNSKPESVALPEPTTAKTQRFVDSLVARGVQIRGKSLRDVKLVTESR